MTVPARPLRITVEEYFALDAAAPEGVRYEYWDGYVVPQHGYDETGAVAMAGASPAHNQIAANLSAALVPAMRKRGCRAGQADQRVQLPAGRYVYPDLVFACGEPRYTDGTPPALLNPTFLVEVAPPSTADRDHGPKRTRRSRPAGVLDRRAGPARGDELRAGGRRLAAAPRRRPRRHGRP